RSAPASSKRLREYRVKIEKGPDRPRRVQNTYCRPSWTVRFPTLDTIFPKSGSVGLVTAFPRRVRLKMLKTSSRKSKCVVPATLKPLRNDMLTSQKPGWRRRFLACDVA